MKKGFTLIELAVVLTIVGIIIASLLVGVSLVTTARTQSIISDSQKYTEAANAFREKFSFYPGDLTDASNYWAAAVAGDGDGVIDSAERPDFWHQLGLSEFISGTYNTTNNFGPLAEIPNAYFLANNLSVHSLTAANYLVVADSAESSGILLGKEALIIDTKIDDGLPNSGKVLGDEPAAGGCISGTLYIAEATDRNCRIYFKF